jgi:hypothetical protein
MSENAIDSESTIKPAPDTAKPKGSHKSWQESQAAKKARRTKPAAKPKAGPHQQEGQGDRLMKRAKGRHVAGDYEARPDFLSLLKKTCHPRPFPYHEMTFASLD